MTAKDDGEEVEHYEGMFEQLTRVEQRRWQEQRFDTTDIEDNHERRN